HNGVVASIRRVVTGRTSADDRRRAAESWLIIDTGDPRDGDRLDVEQRLSTGHTTTRLIHHGARARRPCIVQVEDHWVERAAGLAVAEEIVDPNVERLRDDGVGATFAIGIVQELSLVIPDLSRV